MDSRVKPPNGSVKVCAYDEEKMDSSVVLLPHNDGAEWLCIREVVWYALTDILIVAMAFVKNVAMVMRLNPKKYIKDLFGNVFLITAVSDRCV